MSGVFDFLLRIAISDMDAYDVLMMTKLSKLPDVGNMQSFFVRGKGRNGLSRYVLRARLCRPSAGLWKVSVCSGPGYLWNSPIIRV
jgi:hypothetical protein